MGIGLLRMRIDEIYIYIAYEKAADATKLCTLVLAKPLGPSLQSLSQGAFRLERKLKDRFRMR